MTQWPIQPGRAGYESLLGFTVAGLVIGSIQSFALVWPAAGLPVIADDFAAPANRFAWWVLETGFGAVFPVLLAICFGAWLAATDRAPQPFGGRQWRYLVWLLPIGLLHAYLFWFGDLLVPFALAGLIVAAGARMRLYSQLAVGAGLIVFTALVLIAGSAVGAIIRDSMSSAQALGFPPERVASLDAIYQSGFLARLPSNMGFALMHHLVQIVFMGGGIAGVMLVGMAALDSGFLTLRWTPMQYAVSAAVALGLGLPLCGWANLHLMESGFAPAAFGPAVAAKCLGVPCVAYGYAALVMLACQSGRLDRVTGAFASLGRVWLSAYLGTSVVLVLVFSGIPGLALFARMPRAGLLVLALAIAAGLVFAARWWTRTGRPGPAERAWTALVMRKGSGGGRGPAG